MRAMIVDDEAPARSELRYLLEETGRVDAIMEASSAREAVEKLMEAKADVMFLDIQMPKTSGMQLAEALHRLKNPPAIVFVTAYSEYALEAFEVDAIDYLMKPVDPERLSQALDKVQARSKPQPQSHSSVERIPVVKSGRKVLVRGQGRLLLHLHRRGQVPLHHQPGQAGTEARAARVLPRAPRLHRQP